MNKAGRVTGATALVLAVGLSACSGHPRRVRPATPPQHKTSVSTSSTTSTTATRRPLPPPGPITWTSCGAGFQCATLSVPLDYAQPGGRHLGIALKRRPARDPAQRLGSLVLNPGGPGESGLANLAKDLTLLTAGTRARFDIVAFDPRGVGASAAIRCNPGGAVTQPAAEPDPVPATQAARDALVAEDRAYASACARATGDLLAHVGTTDVARDLDLIRAALGDARLSYLGLSYGTFLGAVYAGMFPTHVRAMVLDGAIDPALSTYELAQAQALGFEASLHAFFDWCRAASASGCAWRPGTDLATAYSQLLARVRRAPLPASGGRQVGPAELYIATYGTLYARSFWPSLAGGLAAAERRDGGPLRAAYEAYMGTRDPAFDADASQAINCLDHPVPTDLGAYPVRAATAGQSAPVFGPLLAWSVVGCAVWPVPESAKRTPAPTHAAGSPPILVVGTTQDPATPYAWARSLAGELDHGVLLTRQGADHVAIFYSGCARAIYESYLVSLRAPAAGTVCSS